ncbi:MAG: sigma-70 family RNA polymerase sigma factor [Candidatus Wallbacteria bacterium]|nr:sigma-70 family RNA polymerase sigma factor [Candidatus Wallbacteria bacterium]
MTETSKQGPGTQTATPRELTTDEGFRMFYEQTQPAVYRLCRFQTGDAETARDLSQEAFAQAYRARRSLRDPAGGRAWMLRIALNACRSHARRRSLAAFMRSLLPWTDAAVTGIADSTPGPEATVEQRERERSLRAALDSLPARERTALALVGLEELSYAAAASVMECSEEAVRQGVCRARRRLRETLGADAAAERVAAQPAGGLP